MSDVLPIDGDAAAKEVRRGWSLRAVLVWVPVGICWAAGTVDRDSVLVAAIPCLALTVAIARTREARPLVTRLLLAWLTAGVTLAAIDFALRGVERQLPGFWLDKESQVRDPHFPSLRRYRREFEYTGPQVGDLAHIRGNPDNGEVRRLTFVSDERGYRNRPGKDPGACDLILVGDSFGAGAGTSQEATWATRLEVDHGRTVYNLAAHGASPLAEIDALRVLAAERPPAAGTVLVWQLFAGNDLDEFELERASGVPMPRNSRVEALVAAIQAWRRRSPIRQAFTTTWRPHDWRNALVELPRPAGVPLLFGRHYLTAVRRSAEEWRSHEHIDRFREAFTEMSALCSELRLEPLVVVVPSKSEVYAFLLEEEGLDPPEAGRSTSFAELCAELCERHGMPVLDLYPELARVARERFESGSLLYWPDGTHWNEAGHELAAAAVAARLR